MLIHRFIALPAARLLSAWLLGSWLLAACPLGTHAQGDVKRLEAARDLARRGLEALRALNFESADALFTQALELHDAPTLRVGRARARTGRGLLASAAQDYRAALAAPAPATALEAVKAAHRDAQAELAALAPRVPRLTVQIQGEATDLTVNGVQWSLSQVGLPAPLDVGEYTIVARNRAGRSSEQQVRLAEGQHETVELSFDNRRPPFSVAATLGYGEVLSTESVSFGFNGGVRGGYTFDSSVYLGVWWNIYESYYGESGTYPYTYSESHFMTLAAESGYEFRSSSWTIRPSLQLGLLADLEGDTHFMAGPGVLVAHTFDKFHIGADVRAIVWSEGESGVALTFHAGFAFGG